MKNSTPRALAAIAAMAMTCLIGATIQLIAAYEGPSSGSVRAFAGSSPTQVDRNCNCVAAAVQIR